MACSSVALLVLALLAVGYGQQPGTLTPEAHPSLPMQTCTAQGVCTTVQTTITLDSNWRWLHTAGGTSNCYTGNTWNSAVCSATTTTGCAAACQLEGLTVANYASTYGITTTSNQITLGFVTKSANTNVGSRVYMMQDANTYQIFKLKNQELAFDVDASKLPCGLNGAVYFTEMAADGGKSAYSGNAAGAMYGTGYCDAQCPHDLKFINGEANTIDWTPSSNDVNSGAGQYGTCCNELDIWEANSVSTAFTPHPCSVTGQTRCSGTQCGDGTERYDGVCDKDGCDFNSFRMGNQSFYGPGQMIDSSSPITVVTQFITSDGTATGDLTEIRRYYKQGTRIIPNSAATFNTLSNSNSITNTFCNAQKTLFGDTNNFTPQGGLKVMGDAMGRGMVMVMSLWDDHDANCLWLDSTYPTTASATTPGAARGTCPTTSGVPATVEANSPSATVTYSNIKVGPLGSTTAGVPASTSTGTITGPAPGTAASGGSSSSAGSGSTGGAGATAGGASATSAAPGTPTTAPGTPTTAPGTPTTAPGSPTAAPSTGSTTDAPANEVGSSSVLRVSAIAFVGALLVVL